MFAESFIFCIFFKPTGGQLFEMKNFFRNVMQHLWMHDSSIFHGYGEYAIIEMHPKTS